MLPRPSSTLSLTATDMAGITDKIAELLERERREGQSATLTKQDDREALHRFSMLLSTPTRPAANQSPFSRTPLQSKK